MHCVIIGEYSTSYLRTESGHKKSGSIAITWKALIFKEIFFLSSIDMAPCKNGYEMVKHSNL